MKNNIVILIAILFLCSFSSLWAEEERRELIFSTLDEVEKEITSQTACVNRDYQQRAISISQALKEAEKLLTEKSLEQPAALTKAKIEPSQPSPSQNFFSDFYLYSPLLTLINNWAGLSPLYFYDSDDFTWNWKKYFGEGAEYVYATLGLQSGYITGDTTYHITFAEDVLGFVFSGESELEFPLDNFLLGVEGVLGYKDFRNDKRDKARLSVSWFTDVSSDAGKMQDSDWLNNNYDILYTGSTHPGLDIYSESDTDLDTNIIDVNYLYNFWPLEGLSIGPIVGYRYQKFEYKIFDTDQVGYGPYGPAGYTTSVSGNTLDYEVKYGLPYLGVNSDVLLADKFKLNLRFAYSFWADAEDRDDHLLRSKLSEGDCGGEAYLVNLNINWEFLPAWMLQVGGEYVDIDTKGTQHQAFYDGSGVTYDVDDKITSSHWSISANLKYRF